MVKDQPNYLRPKDVFPIYTHSLDACNSLMKIELSSTIHSIRYQISDISVSIHSAPTFNVGFFVILTQRAQQPFHHLSKLH